MADERNVIEIILQARDDTSAAFASLAAKMGLQKEMAQQLARENKNLEDSSRSLDAQTQRSRVSFDDLRQSMGKQQTDFTKNIKLTNDLAKAYADVERTTQQAVAAQDRRTSSLAQQAVAEAQAAAAQKNLSKVLRDQIKDMDDLDAAEKKYMNSAATRHAASVRQANEDLALNQRRKAMLQETAAAQDKADADAARAAQQRAAQTARDARDQKAQTDAAIADIKRQSNALTQYQNEIKKVAALKKEAAKSGLGDTEKISIEIDTTRALAKAKALKEEIKSIASGETTAKINLNSDEFKAQVGEVEALKLLVGKDIHINVDADVATATAQMEAFNVEKNRASDGSAFESLGGAFGALASKITEGGGSVAAFDNVLRGAAAFAIAGFLQPIIVLAGAAAGALLALGSAAIYAGGALAGGLVAGLAQAIPVLGVVALAAYRLMAVFKAVQQSNLAQQQAATQGATIHQTAARSANTYANALDGIRSAEEQLASAHRNVGVAETALSKARQQAARDIQDLVLAEKEAQLQAEASSLAQQNAAKALTVAIATGGDVQQAQLDVQSANLDAQRSAVQLPRAQADAATAQRQGVSGAPGVQSAARQLADAQRGVKDAETAVDRAKRSADQAGDAATLAGAKIAGAGAKLDYLVGKLSPAEKRLYDIAKQAQLVFTNLAKTISQPIIEAAGTIIERLIGIFKDPRIVAAMTGLSSEMAKQGLRLFSAFTDKKSIDTFLGFVRDAQKNLGPLTSILINIGKIFLDIAKAAAPTLSALLKFFDQVTGKFAKFTDSTKGQNTLSKFFAEGTKALIAFMNLGGAVVKLFLAIAGPGGGAKTGIALLVGATGGINKLADSINKGGKAAKFFHDMFQITKDVIKLLGPLFTSIGDQLGQTFTKKGEGSVKGFVNVFAKILIPALGDFIRKVGSATSTIGKFLENNPEITKLAASFIGIAVSGALLWKALSLGLGPILKIAEGLGKLLLGADGLTVVLEAIGGVLADLVWPIAITVGIGILLAKLGLLKPLIGVFVDGFKEFAKIAGPPFKDLVTQVGRLWDAFGKGKGAFAIIKPILSFLISEVLSRGVKWLAAFIGTEFAGVFKILAGAIGLVVDILTGKWGKAWDDVKKILSGMADIALAGIKGFLAAFGDLPGKVLHFFKKIISDIENFLGIASPSKKFFNIGIDLIRGLINGIASLGGALLNIGGKILHWIWNGIIAWGTAEFKIGKWIFDHISGAIGGLVNTLGDLGGKIIKWIWNGLLAWARTEFTIGKWIFDHISDGIANLGGKLGNIGKIIIDAIVGGLKAAKDDVKDALDWVIDHVPGGKLIRKGLAIIGINLAEGGPIPGGYGGGDIVPARLEPGEHVWTKEEVRSAGGHAAMYAMRSAFGAGGQGGGGRYAVGGRVSLPNQSQIDASVTLSTDPAFKQAVKFSNDFQTLWRKLWTAIEQTTVTATNFLTKQFTTLHDNVIKLITQVNNNVTGQFNTIRKQTTQDAQQLTQSIVQSLSNLDNAISKSMEYVGTATNQALKTFNVKPVELNVDKPPGLPGSGKAGGGWVGNRGERGQDAIATVLGRGEAVLNWGHQRIVDPALRAMYGFGLGDMFDRTYGRHAGIDGRGPRGYAKGGNVWKVRASAEESASGNGWTELSTNGNAAAVSGHPHTATHSGGWDFATLGRQYPKGTLLKIKAPNGKSGIFPQTDIGDGSSFAPAIGLTPAVQAALGGMPAEVEISLADGGDIHLASGFGTLVSGSGGFAAGTFDAAAAAVVQHMKKLKITGGGALQSIAQAAANKVVNAANSYLDSIAPSPAVTGGGGGAGPVAPPPSGPMPYAVQKALFAARTLAARNEPYVTGGYGWNAPGLDCSGYVSTVMNYAGLMSGYLITGPLKTWGVEGDGKWITVGVRGADSGPGGHTMMAIDGKYFESSGHYVGGGPHVDSGWSEDFPWRRHPKGLASGGFADGGKHPQLSMQDWYRLRNGDRSMLPKYNPDFAKWAELLQAARGGFVGSYDVGGELPGSPGQPIPIIAHAQEWVVNKGQQSKIASWLGTSRDQLKGALGFTGGPTSFAGGGEPTSFRDPVTAKDLSIGNFADLVGLIMPGGIAGWNRLVVRVNTAIKKFGDKVGDFFKGVNSLVAQDGVFDQLSAAIDARLAQMQTGLALAQSGLRRITRGGVTRLVRRPALSVTQSDRRDLDVTAANVAALDKERAEMAGELRKINKQITDAKKGTKAYQNLLGARNRLLADLDSTDQKIAQDRADQFAKQQTLFEQQTTNALRRPTIAAARADLRSQTGSALDNDKTIVNAGRAQVDALKDQQKVLQRRAKEAAAKARKDPRWQQVADDLAQQVRDGAASIVEAQATNVQNAQTAFQDQLTKQLRRSTNRQQWSDLASRIGSALGNTDIVAAASNVQISALKGQQKILEQHYNEAAAKAKKDPRWQSIADDLSSQLADTTASIVEAQAAALQARVDVLNNNVTRQQASVDIANRLADIQESMGNPVGAAQARLRNMQTTGNILTGQIGGLQGLLGAAQRQGNVGLIDTLTDQIADLKTQLAENTAAMSDQTVAVRQATLDQINNRAQFQTGVFGGLGTLVAAVATNLNTDTSQQQEALLQKTFSALQNQFSQLASALFSGFGVNLMGLSGTNFASAVSQLNFSALESGMTQAQQGQFEALIQALIDTQNALASNTTQLDTLTGTLGQAQSFSSTAWQVLRMAVFTGAGGLLPQFQIPSMQSGGYVSKSGIFNLHAGEFVVNPSHPGGQQIGNGDVNVTVHEAGPETDYTYLANRIAFATRTPST